MKCNHSIVQAVRLKRPYDTLGQVNPKMSETLKRLFVIIIVFLNSDGFDIAIT